MAAENAGNTRRGKRRQAILDAAEALFLEKGYEATTLGDVVARSGGSLATLYDLFGGKPGLLAAMVADRCTRMMEYIDAADLADLAPEIGLRKIARHLFDQIEDASGIGLLRVVIAEAPRLPELGRRFYEAGPATGRRIMARYIEGQVERGALVVEAPEAAATMFFHMLLGEHHMRLLCGLPVETQPDERDRHIDGIVSAFMRLHSREP